MVLTYCSIIRNTKYAHKGLKHTIKGPKIDPATGQPLKIEPEEIDFVLSETKKILDKYSRLFNKQKLEHNYTIETVCLDNVLGIFKQHCLNKAREETIN